MDSGSGSRDTRLRNSNGVRLRLTLIHPCIGRRAEESYIRSWQMEPLPAATIAGLTPKDIEIRFYDDRMERIPYDDPTDLVAISVETYTAKRAYQIASEYRRRNVPVVMGGFHASLCPGEVANHAESVVVGEAEDKWEQLLDDFRSGRLAKVYRSSERPSLGGLRPDRSIFRGKRYLPIGLIEATRGCSFNCDFCAIQSMFHNTQTRRPVDDIVAELDRIKHSNKLLFFVDDNITLNTDQTKVLLRALAPLEIRWVSQAGFDVGYDEELLDLLVRSGCRGLLIGFESIDPASLKSINKTVNIMGGGYDKAMENLHRYRIPVYGTFLFGCDNDTPETFEASMRFAQRHRMYIAAFNHITPFPGTPLYKRLGEQNRLLYEAWWLDDEYRYNMIPYKPANMSTDELQHRCLSARRSFYSWGSVLRRFVSRANRPNSFMSWSFFLINAMIRRDTNKRDGFPLGDAAWTGRLLRAQ